MPVLDGVVLNKGKQVISNALLGLTPAVPSKFNIGTTFGFDPDPTDTDVRGTLVHTGTSNSISAARVADDTVRYVCVIEESYGPFDVGNIVLFLEDDKGNVLPFVSVVLPVSLRKVQSDPDTVISGFQVPGSRMAFNIEIKHTDEATVTSVTVITPDYSSLATFATEIDVPQGPSLTFRSFVVQYDSRTKTPVLYTVDADNIRWGIPYSQQIEDPNFGSIDGGNDGEGYGGEAFEIIFGYYYTTLESQFTDPVIGGGAYEDNLSSSLGGATYTQTVNEQTNQV